MSIGYDKMLWVMSILEKNKVKKIHIQDFVGLLKKTCGVTKEVYQRYIEDFKRFGFIERDGDNLYLIIKKYK